MISRASLSSVRRMGRALACSHCRPSTASALTNPSIFPFHHEHVSTHSLLFSTRVNQQQGEGGPAKEAISNRAAFKNTPIIPSILAHIERIGVGIRSKPKRRRRPRNADEDNSASGKGRSRRGDTLDEAEEREYFTESDRRHRLQRQGRNSDEGARGRRASGNTNRRGTEKEAPERTGAHWLPPPPFSSFSKADTESDRDELGRRIIRRPVKLLGKAGTLNDKLPWESKGLAEVAIAGRSNVGKSTLLNALLYGNIDEKLAPREFRRGRTPEGAKLPRGAKAITSNRPGETRELSFYQLTADVITGRSADGMEDDDASGPKEKKAKMSLLLCDLPGYGFAYAKDERKSEWRELMHHYLLERRSLKRILLLLDARHGFKSADWEFLGELQDGLLAKADDAEKNVGKAKRELPPIQLVLTKCDLVKQSDLARRVVVVREQLSDFLIREPSSLPVMLVSARAGLGFNNVRGGTPLGGVLELQRELASLAPAPRK